MYEKFMIFNVSSKSRHSTSGATFYNFENDVDLNSDLLIGLSPTNYHCFLLCKNFEYHPSLSMRKSRMLTKKNQVIRACIFFRISGLSMDQVNLVEKELLKQVKRRTESCHLGVYDFLASTIGMSSKYSQQELRYHPSRFIESFLENQIKFLKCPKAKIDVFLVRDLDLIQTMADIKKYERKFFVGYFASFLLHKFYTFFKISGSYKVSIELRTILD